MERTIRPIITEASKQEMRCYGEKYFYIKGYAEARKWNRTLRALPLGRRLHAGQTRRGTMTVDGKEVHIPYYYHCLSVCTRLLNTEPNLSEDDLDKLYAAALLHDTIEDCGDDGGGRILLENGIDEEVVNIVRLLSKPSGASAYELSEYFNRIKLNPLALLIKIADRSDNTETIYTFTKQGKMQEYIAETETWVFPLCSYGKEQYPHLSNCITIIKSTIKTAISIAKAMSGMYDKNGGGGNANDGVTAERRPPAQIP